MAGYRERVQEILRENGVSDALSAQEEGLVAAGIRYAVGPNDCAMQIIDDRRTFCAANDNGET